ncbi:alpha/beta hydrolase family esterase [Mycobacterium sp.]|uniref:extracellular catalytic domain type 1 short-chain-length polyhydroxyalkanoate depolymerase n=1 Tax=Mycobacterium sp. TaxID=1785 RepID=UPI003C7263A6
MAHRLAALILGAALVLAGCSAIEDWTLPTGFVTGTSIHHMTVGGHDRSYRLYIPAGVPASAALVVMMHGYSATAKQAERASKWDETADAGKFVVAYPDGLDRAWNVNGGGCCGRPARKDVDDIGFIRATVSDISRNIGIDSHKVYATGMSNGGIMSYTLACATDIFAAIGPVAGAQLNSCQSPHPTSVMHIHGTADPVVPYTGGQGFNSMNFPPAQESDAFWRKVDQCGNPAVTTAGRVATSTAGSADNRGVVLITVDGGGHEWPSFAAHMLWDFFATHPH